MKNRKRTKTEKANIAKKKLKSKNKKTVIIAGVIVAVIVLAFQYRNVIKSKLIKE
jgi:uncharacterized integral membrane protein